MELKQLNIEIPEKDLKELKMYAIEKGVTLKMVVIQALALYLKYNRYSKKDKDAL